MAGPLGGRDLDSIAKYTNTYTTFSGADIVCMFNGTEVGSLSGITWSVTREKAPIFTMGSPNPRSFSRGKRGIAGSMIFTTFDRPALYTLLQQSVSRGNDEMKIWTRVWNTLPNTGSGQAAGLVPYNSNSTGVAAIMPYYADQIPPFDVTVTYLNEYGQAAVRSIYGVELLNEGSGASMDDVGIEETMTYVAREVGPMIPTTRNFAESDGTISDAVVQGFGLS